MVTAAVSKPVIVAGVESSGVFAVKTVTASAAFVLSSLEVTFKTFEVLVNSVLILAAVTAASVACSAAVRPAARFGCHR